MDENHVLRDRVEALIRKEIAEDMQIDGMGIDVLDVEDQIVRIRMNGVCSGCPATIMTLVQGIEYYLRQRIPEVAFVEAVP